MTMHRGEVVLCVSHSLLRAATPTMLFTPFHIFAPGLKCFPLFLTVQRICWKMSCMARIIFKNNLFVCFDLFFFIKISFWQIWKRSCSTFWLILFCSFQFCPQHQTEAEMRWNQRNTKIKQNQIDLIRRFLLSRSRLKLEQWSERRGKVFLHPTTLRLLKMSSNFVIDGFPPFTIPPPPISRFWKIFSFRSKFQSSFYLE